MKRIYDGFTFFNEFDLLELRLAELYEHVDYFILVESDHTFTNIPKPYYFEENRQRYSKFLDKIIHVKLRSAKYDNPWENEFRQRNGILEGCYNAKPDDIIIISDVDEIHRVSAIEEIRNSDDDVYALYNTFFYFKFNVLSTRPDCYIPNVLAAKMSILSNITPQTLREARDYFMKSPYQYADYKCRVIHHAGWHFSYLGDIEFVKRKLVSFSHAAEHTKESMEHYTVESEMYENEHRFFVQLDDYFPKTLLNNLDKYHQYIVDGATHTVASCFPQHKI
jgi:hypothetical protein